jgi:sRNA-binding protein
MPSGEEYQDSPMSGEPAGKAEKAEEKESQAPGMDALAGMTEDDIAAFLSQSRVESQGSQAEGDLLDMLEGEDDSDLQDIQDMLQKSDRNETIQEGRLDTEGYAPGESPADRLLADIEGAGTGDVSDKKKQRALRREEKAAKKAAKKAAREEAKAAKAAGKKKKGGKGRTDVSFDREALDDIVSGAGALGGRRGSGPEDVIEVPLGKAETGGVVPDLLEPDVMAIDMDQVDDLFPDIGEKKKPKEKKQNFLSKAISFLMEEEEEEDLEPIPENEDILLSEENQEILKALGEEDKKAASKGKDKKKAKKKAKKPPKKKAPKAPKPPKPKKEKKPKEKEPEVPGRRLSFKKVLPIALLGASFGAVLLIFVYLSIGFGNKQAAKDAYKAGDYEGCYLNLYGRDRSETEEMMYVKSESILRMKLWLREYEMFVEDGSEVKALDSLIQSVNDYPELHKYASQWEAVAEVYDGYALILSILSEKYGITEAQALEIAAVESDFEYTRIVTALAEGGSYGSWGKVETPAPEKEETTDILPDELPEEAETGQGGFVDNQ